MASTTTLGNAIKDDPLKLGQHEFRSRLIVGTGKYADFAVLEKDYFTVPVEEILDTKIIMTGLGGEIVRLIETQPNETDLRTPALKIIKSNPDVVFLANYVQVGPAARRLRDSSGLKGWPGIESDDRCVRPLKS